MELVVPGLEHVDSYVDARRSGFAWGLLGGEAAIADALRELAADPGRWLQLLQDDDPVGRTITLPDGSAVPRLPQFTRWMWDGAFAGVITFRWQPGSDELPPHVLGHIGYGVVESRRRRGYATQALRDILVLPRNLGLSQVQITADPDNIASQRVILNNGGRCLGTSPRPEAQGGAPITRFVIDL